MYRSLPSDNWYIGKQLYFHETEEHARSCHAAGHQGLIVHLSE